MTTFLPQGTVVKMALPAPGQEGERYYVSAYGMALWSDGTETGHRKVVLVRQSDGAGVVAGAGDVVRADQ